MERMQKILSQDNNCPQKDSTECKGYEGVQTVIGITENHLVEVNFTTEHLMEYIFSSGNLNSAYLQVKRNAGAGGVDNMEVGELLPYLQRHKDELVKSLMQGTYRPNPVRRVEIPKDNGKKRRLGIPGVVDRVIQQAISQVLTLIYDRTFSNSSFGFRPKRSCHQALRTVQEHVSAGYKYAIDLDLEKFFDSVNHSKLIEVLSKTIKDNRLLSLIHKYLNAGVVVSNKFEETTLGVPQGGPLSPLLSNIMLNELDKELESRGHRFVRYADDCMILCKSKRAAKRTQESIIRFIEDKLFLKVNKEKTKVGYIQGMKFLGYSFYVTKGKCKLSLHPKSKAKLKSRLKELTSRSKGFGYERCKIRLKEYIRGWIGYYQLADMRSYLQSVDEWLRRRLRMCIWKSWKKVKTKFANLLKCKIGRNQAWQWANTRKSYWRTSKSPILSRALDNESLRKAGYPFLSDYYSKVYRT
jgi:group II intron reverse transcriptase/maturase